jgi:GNAT superfamily N-acetyltransferase
MTITITNEAAPDQKDTDAVRHGLEEYNLRHAPASPFEPLTLLVRDDAGKIVGGLLGGIYWSWLYVEILWLDDTVRSQGVGSQLLQQAEELARSRGCIAAHLDTMSFQAQGFYEKQGYQVYGILDDLPPGHRRIFLQKRLSQ